MNISAIIDAAENGDAVAQFNLGSCYSNGNGVEKDSRESVFWFTKAAQQGHAGAQNSLGDYYRDRNSSTAVKWYSKAAQQGNANAQNSLGDCYRDGKGVSKDLKEAVKWYRKAAELGLADAQNKLGMRYYKGEGVSKDLNEAAKWFKKAAEQGHSKAQNNLGERYRFGEGVATDLKEAVKWFQKAANQGCAEAQFNLGYCYENGSGISKDPKLAVEYYVKAAKQGIDIDSGPIKNAEIQLQIGSRYKKGESIDKDLKKAIKWFTKAAEQGLADAQFSLGLMYGNGEGVEKDTSKALKWYTKAAQQGHAGAQNNIGSMYNNGEGVEKDLKEAKKWFKKAAEQGNDIARDNLELQKKIAKDKWISYLNYYFFFLVPIAAASLVSRYIMGIDFSKMNFVFFTCEILCILAVLFLLFKVIFEGRWFNYYWNRLIVFVYYITLFTLPAAAISSMVSSYFGDFSTGNIVYYALMVLSLCCAFVISLKRDFDDISRHNVLPNISITFYMGYFLYTVYLVANTDFNFNFDFDFFNSSSKPSYESVVKEDVINTPRGPQWSMKATSKMNWKSAVKYCENLNEGGHSDWRLPDIDELRTLVQNCQGTGTGGACKASAKNNCLSDNCWKESDCAGCSKSSSTIYSELRDKGWLWSSSVRSDSPDRVWGINFDSAVIGRKLNKAHEYHVRCVR